MGATIDDEMDDFPDWVGPYAHADGYALTLETEIVAGVDPDSEKREAFTKRYEVKECTRRSRRSGFQPDAVPLSRQRVLRGRCTCPSRSDRSSRAGGPTYGCTGACRPPA